MNNSFPNTLERRDGTLAVRDNAKKRRMAIRSNLITTAVLLGGGAYAWSQHSVVLIVLNAFFCVMALPLTLLVLLMETRAAFAGTPGIELDAHELRFRLASRKIAVAQPHDISELILMPSAFGQTLIVVPRDERAFRARLSPLSRFYMTMSRLYCGHTIGLTANLNPADFAEFSSMLERTFPNQVSVMQKAHQQPLLARLLGNFKRPEGAMPAHIPPPLVRL